ncbi:MAG: hypothetical protein Kow0029_23800 [Candidatus Rifleibacteriota bacterium]
MIDMRISRKLVFIILFLFALNGYSFADENKSGEKLKVNLKEGLRNVFGKVSRSLDEIDFGKLPEGLEIIDIPGCKGIKITQGKFEIRVDTWPEDIGLLQRFKVCREIYGKNLIAAINGTFYSSRGVLGPVVSDRAIPGNVRQIPGSLSRCFVASFRATKNRQYWYIGETSEKGSTLVRYALKDLAWFNVPEIYGTIDNLLGGGGWILRSRHDVHNESYTRQRFLFRKEDKTSRHSVIAQDSERNLYLLVFEEGQTLHMIARKFVKEPVFSKVQDAFFIDGGASSAIVLKGKYLVSPLYVVDKARFSALQVIVLDAKW